MSRQYDNKYYNKGNSQNQNSDMSWGGGNGSGGGGGMYGGGGGGYGGGRGGGYQGKRWIKTCEFYGLAYKFYPYRFFLKWNPVLIS